MMNFAHLSKIIDVLAYITPTLQLKYIFPMYSEDMKGNLRSFYSEYVIRGKYNKMNYLTLRRDMTMSYLLLEYNENGNKENIEITQDFLCEFSEICQNGYNNLLMNQHNIYKYNEEGKLIVMNVSLLSYTENLPKNKLFGLSPQIMITEDNPNGIPCIGVVINNVTASVPFEKFKFLLQIINNFDFVQYNNTIVSYIGRPEDSFNRKDFYTANNNQQYNQQTDNDAEKASEMKKGRIYNNKTSFWDKEGL